MRLIDADILYKAMQDAEELARRRVRDTESTLPYLTNLNPAYTRYLAQMDERTKAKEMVADAPTVDAAPVVRCGECIFWDRCHVSCEGLAKCLTGEGGIRYRNRSDFCSKGRKREGDNHE